MNAQTDIHSDRVQLSALADGELGGGDAARVLGAMDASAVRECWHLYHLIGDVLRAPDLGDARGDAAFVARLRECLPPQMSVVAPPPTASTPSVPDAARPAANDGVFRWKMVAGLASVAAVAAIGWGSLGSIGPGVPAGGAQLASNTAPALNPNTLLAVAQPAPQAASPAAAGTTAVMLRDPELDQLLAAHRQAAGASAFGDSAAFMRTATLEGPAR